MVIIFKKCVHVGTVLSLMNFIWHVLQGHNVSFDVYGAGVMSRALSAQYNDTFPKITNLSVLSASTLEANANLFKIELFHPNERNRNHGAPTLDKPMVRKGNSVQRTRYSLGSPTTSYSSTHKYFIILYIFTLYDFASFSPLSLASLVLGFHSTCVHRLPYFRKLLRWTYFHVNFLQEQRCELWMALRCIQTVGLWVLHVHRRLCIFERQSRFFVEACHLAYIFVDKNSTLANKARAMVFQIVVFLKIRAHITVR